MYLCIVFAVFVQSALGGERIIGGRHVKITDHPYQAALYINETGISPHYGYRCGAVILSPEVLLTAAHCVLRKPEVYSVVVGQSVVPWEDDGSWLTGKAYRIKDRFIHPKFDRSCYQEFVEDYENDIAILIVDGKMNLDGRSSRAISLTPRRVFPGSVATVSGYGFSEQQLGLDGKTQDVNPQFIPLKAAKVPIVSRDICTQYYRDLHLTEQQLTENMICAGTWGAGSCYGDSGGPLVQGNELIGLASLAESCGQNAPEIYTAIHPYTEFIYAIASDKLEPLPEENSTEEEYEYDLPEQTENSFAR